MYRLTIKDILEATGGVLLCGDENTEIKDVCINSKEIKPGDLFVPIIGERVDADRKSTRLNSSHSSQSRMPSSA